MLSPFSAEIGIAVMSSKPIPAANSRYSCSIARNVCSE